MNREEIIKLAKNSGLFVELVLERDLDWLERFAKLVAEHERDKLIDAAMKAAEKGIDTAIALEREACAKVCDEFLPLGNKCAYAIRARGQA
jgi:hypothetical protein